MDTRWNAWTRMQAVRFDYEKSAKPREVRLSASSVVIGEPVRIGVSGVEIAAVVTDVEDGVLVVKVKRTPAKVVSAKAATPKPTTKKRTG